MVRIQVQSLMLELAVQFPCGLSRLDLQQHLIRILQLNLRKLPQRNTGHYLAGVDQFGGNNEAGPILEAYHLKEVFMTLLLA
jgi:hypothetical protein